MTVLFCNHCYDEKEATVEKLATTFDVRGDKITVSGQVPVCTECNQRISNPEFDGPNLLEAYREYRRRYGLLQQEEIVELRKKYELSQRAMARLFGWGPITVQRYESGSLQDLSHNHLMLSMRDPNFVANIVQSPTCKLGELEKQGLLRRLSGDTAASLREQTLANMEQYLTQEEPSEFTGYRRPDLHKLVRMALFFAHRLDGYLFKVKLMKMWFYADFLHFRRQGVSISGFPYAALAMGPVPDRYQTVLAWIEGMSLARFDEIPTQKKMGEALIPTEPFEPLGLSEDESKDLEDVVRTFAMTPGYELADISHKEPAWMNTPSFQRISYKWANDLQALK